MRPNVPGHPLLTLPAALDLGISFGIVPVTSGASIFPPTLAPSGCKMSMTLGGLEHCSEKAAIGFRLGAVLPALGTRLPWAWTASPAGPNLNLWTSDPCESEDSEGIEGHKAPMASAAGAL